MSHQDRGQSLTRQVDQQRTNDRPVRPVAGPFFPAVAPVLPEPEGEQPEPSRAPGLAGDVYGR